ncbi:MAG: aminodeoxychorismate synthase component I [Candidatus Hydrogenedentes bacterium]|nr:aminodeoxychorismate synthase component I [Candidatus Hydrogenedentota bacterium]
MTAFGDIHFVSRSGSRWFRDPVAVCVAERLEEVAPCLAAVAEHVTKGHYAAGFLSYEAAQAFDKALRCHAASPLPLAWFGVYEEPAEDSTPDDESFAVGAWEASLSRDAYVERVQRLRALIAAGDTYQVNFTFPLRATFQGSAHAWFRALCNAQPTDHAAFLDLGRHKIVSVSPELFFERDGLTLRVRPMKGTASRGRFPEEDEAQARALAASNKNRAENVMIVDLLRNDLGRIGETGSVCVERLFDVERYPTLWQMTSTIACEARASVPEIFAALFPSGSVTGAPKVRTMEIIREFEDGPRGVYCGTIGYWEPSGRAAFNVAIRTATVDTETGTVEYPVGSGITWDSAPDGEFEECLAKAAVLTAHRPEFSLLESILYEGGYFLLDRHLDRLAASARYFDIPFDMGALRAALDVAARDFIDVPLKVRLLVDRDGCYRIESAPAPVAESVRVGLARTPVNSIDIFLFHKTTHRTAYETARASRPDCDEVLLWNERGEITESTAANVVVELDGRMVTPPVSCGLLAGTFRAELLARGEIAEGVITVDDLARCSAIHLVNSVRLWIPVDFIAHTESVSETVAG